MAKVSTPNVIPVKTNTSVSTCPMGSCWIISTLMAEIYQRAGTMHENHCKAKGMFSIGKIIPDSMTTGIMNITPEISRAETWVDAMVEISNPNAKASTIYRIVTHITLMTLAEKGIPNTV